MMSFPLALLFLTASASVRPALSAKWPCPGCTQFRVSGVETRGNQAAADWEEPAAIVVVYETRSLDGDGQHAGGVAGGLVKSVTSPLFGLGPSTFEPPQGHVHARGTEKVQGQTMKLAAGSNPAESHSFIIPASIFLAGSIADAATTLSCVLRGLCYEANPLMLGTSIPKITTVKALSTIGVLYGLREIEKTKPRLSKWLAIGGGSALAGLAIRNARVR